MKFIGIIPARYASTRFPGKPLADMAGRPMIQRVYEQVKPFLVIFAAHIRNDGTAEIHCFVILVENYFR